MKRILLVLFFALIIISSVVPLGCAGMSVGVSVPLGYPMGGWGPSVGVGVAVPIGRPAYY